KSTYLTKLNDLLNQNQVVSLLHHYFIPNDASPMDRLQPERVIEGLKALFKKHPKALGRLANMDSRNLSLREFISQAAGHFNKQGNAFVLIIDGLDHVLR